LAADRLVLAQLVGRDRLAGLGDHGLLAGNQRKIARRRFDLLAVCDRLADAHVDDDFVDHRHLHGILVAELLGELLAHHRVEYRLQARRGRCDRLCRRGRRLVGFGGLLALLAFRLSAVSFLAFSLLALSLGGLRRLGGFGLVLGLGGLLGLL